MLRSAIFLPVLIAFVLSAGPSRANTGFPEIKHLKNLYLETSLVRNGAPTAVIVAPKTGFLGRQAEELAAKIHTLSGSILEVISDQAIPEEVLKGRNVIALGNMSNNRFIEHLYRQWQVVLDLTYPGKGGYVVRSLHNPYGTGHNVIFIGGSDDAGVAAAVTAFTTQLGKPKNGTFSVGRLMEIRLGQDVQLPVIGPFLSKWQVYSWNDSWRKTLAGRNTGYPPASIFGWNPISVAGILYYMTGKKEYMDCFKSLAMPDPQNIPLANRTDDAFNDPLNPLVKNYHYRSHLVDCVYDLIEESPFFSNEERLFITNKLLEHQFEYDPKNTYTAPNGDRHGLWHLMNIYTGSRYFATYYPNPIWDQRIENVRTSFRSLLNNPTWADRDTLYWVSTSLEPAFEFFLMDGYAEFVRSGTAKTMLDALEVLMSGDEIDDFNKYVSMGLLLRAAHMTGDSRYYWMLRQTGYDFDVFRIGQSYWPSQSGEPKPPVDLVGGITVAPLAGKDRVASGTPVPDGEGFQVLSYRTGLEKYDDYLLLDGFEGLGRHPYQVNTLLRLRMFGGKDILSGYGNDLNVWFNGMSGNHVARSAALKERLAGKDFAYLHTEVPDMPGSCWQRHILVLKGEGAVVVDRLIPREQGRFDVVSSWQFGSKVKSPGKPSRRMVYANGTGFSSADHLYEQLTDTLVQAKVSRELDVSETLSLANIFFKDSNPRAISPLRNGGYLVSGARSAFVGVGPRRDASLSVAAEFCWLEDKRILLDGATELIVRGVPVFRSDRPVTLMWDLVEGSVRIDADGPGTISLGNGIRTVASGEQVFAGVLSPAGQDRGLAAIFPGLESEVVDPLSRAGNAVPPPASWQPSREIELGGKITAIEAVHGAGENGFWVVSQEKQTATLVRIAGDGTILRRIQQPGEILSLRSAGSTGQSRAFGVLAGFRDDTLRAYTDSGKELWNVLTSLHPSFIIGDRYDAPWFTDPRPPNNKTGVYSILVGDLWGKGREEIAVGRPCTVEFRALDGRLKGRTPTRWGDNTSLALLNKSGKGGSTPLLLAGKAYTGNPQLSGIGADYKNVSDSLFAAITPGFTQMHAWLQRGMSGLETADLDGDGSDEVVYTLSGHWNELRVYEASGAVRWMKYFGPDKAGGTFMSALELADLDGDGLKEILVGTKSGWLHIFDRRGNLVWQRHFDGGITAVSVDDVRRRIAVGCSDGSLVLLDAGGSQLAVGKFDGVVTTVVNTLQGFVAGNATGQVHIYGNAR
jgi:hypothetical protein